MGWICYDTLNDGANWKVLEFALPNPFDKQLEPYDKSKLTNRVILYNRCHLFLVAQTWLNMIVDFSIDFPVRKNCQPFLDDKELSTSGKVL